MKKDKFEEIVDPKKYQVFVMSCPANSPFIFAVHSWFICNEKGKISRWEVLFRKNREGNYLYKNHDKPFNGIEVFPFYLKLKWGSRLLIKIEDREAEKIIKIIKESKQNYPWIDKYSLLGSNSNTYAQWILNHSDKFKEILPWNAFGKNYNYRQK